MQLNITGAQVDQETIITTAQIKAHLRVTNSLEDDLIDSMRNASIAWIEQYCDIKIGSYTAEGFLPYFLSSYIPMGPVISIQSVKYQTTASQANDDLTTLPAANWFYDLHTRPCRIAFQSTPSTYDYAWLPVKVSMTIGHAVGSIPEPIIHAIRLLTASLYENRQEEITATTHRLKMGLEALLNPYRIIYQP